MPVKKTSKSNKRKKGEFADNDEAAKAIAKSFFYSQPLAQKMSDCITRHGEMAPFTAVFAILVVERFMAAQIPDYHQMKNVASKALDRMAEEGIIPGINKEGKCK